MTAGVLEAYKEFLPVTGATPLITMGEGNTPLVKSSRLGKELGCDELYFKLEGCNPTGSFKDRGMVVAMAKALEEGSRAVMCASTGNTSASAAAYSAHCNLPVFVIIPKGEVAMGKLAQAMAYGARILMVNGNFDDALALARDFTYKYEVTLVNSVNPHRLEGQKTAAFEIVDALGEAPDYVFIPVGNAGNITAYWKGFREYQASERSKQLPRMMGFQAEGAAPIVRGKPIKNPQTIASAIRIGNPASWEGAVEARDSSGGVIDWVSDDEILDAYRELASKEGIFCEAASAAAFAGLVKMRRQGLNLEGQRVVCIFTGNGLKDTDLAVRSVVNQTVEIEPTHGSRRGSGLGHGRLTSRVRSIQQQLVKQAIIALLQGVGEDPTREGLQETPERVANMYEWLLSGVGLDPASAIDTVFEAEHRDPVVLSNIPFYSLCEHHLLPFFGIAHMAYVPNSKISGLSKLARALEVAARRLQVQERLTGQVADCISSALDPDGVVVQLEAEHLCMAMRGIQKPGHRVTTTAARGRFEHFAPGRDGLLALLNRR